MSKHTNKELQGAAACSDKANYEIEIEAKLPLTKLSRIIHGAIQPSEEEKEAIANALGVKVGEIFQDSQQLNISIFWLPTSVYFK